MRTVDALIEIPEGSRNKYEFDRKTGRIYLNRMLFSSIRYPTNYGLIPDTLALDGDELDILVLSSEPVFPGCYVECRPIGGLEMWDQDEPDEKILAVPIGEPRWQNLTTYTEVPAHLLREIEHFFLRYKELEKKVTKIGQWRDASWAFERIDASLRRYRERNS